MEYLLKNLYRSFEETNSKIEELIKCLEILLHELYQKKSNIMWSVSLEGGMQENDKSNEDCQLLTDIICSLEKNCVQNKKVIENVIDIVEPKDYTGQHAVFVTSDSGLQVAEYCENNAKEMYNFIDEIVLKYNRRDLFQKNEEVKKSCMIIK